MKPRVQQSTVPRFGLLGVELWWEVWVGMVCLGEMRAWGDAVLLANLTHRRLSASSQEDT